MRYGLPQRSVGYTTLWNPPATAGTTRRTAVPEFVLVSKIVTLQPSSGALPGHATIQRIANGIGWWGLVAALVGVILGAAAWGLGSHTNNYQYSASGRRAVLVSALAALVIGAAPEVISFLFTQGSAVR
jgi:hypothetical protein